MSLPGGNNRFSITSDNTLQIRYLYASDAGAYTCTATNAVGSASHKVTVSVEGNIV